MVHLVNSQTDTQPLSIRNDPANAATLSPGAPQRTPDTPQPWRGPPIQTSRRGLEEGHQGASWKGGVLGADEGPIRHEKMNERNLLEGIGTRGGDIYPFLLDSFWIFWDSSGAWRSNKILKDVAVIILDVSGNCD